MEVGAGTSHTATFLRALGPEPWKAAYVQPSRRPKDGRYGENPNRLQHYYQYQVVLKPAPANILELYLGSLEALGFDLKKNDIRFVEDDWENPTLGAWGLGWEVWLNGMEVTQFTYFQQVGGIDCKPITGEITYGLERLAMYLQGVDNVYNLKWTEGLSYGDVYQQNEVEQSRLQLRAQRRRVPVHRLRRAREAGQAPDGAAARAAGLRAGAQGRRTASTCWTRAARSASPSAPPTSAASATWRAAWRRATTRAASAWASRWRQGWATRCWRRLAEEGGLTTTATTNLLVELFVEELPPKALKKLGEAFAARAARAAARRRAWPTADVGADRRSPRRAAWPRTSPTCAAQAADKARVAEAHAGERRPRCRRRSRRRRC